MMFRGQSSSTDPALFPVLSPEHLERFCKPRGITPETARKARLASLSKHQLQELLGLAHTPPCGGVGIPYSHRPQEEEYWRVRLDAAERGTRYLVPRARVRPYLPPPALVPEHHWTDPSSPVVLVEGPPKALALVSAGMVAIGLGGVEAGGHDVDARRRGETKLHPELRERVVWTGRKVILLFDSNRAVNWRVFVGERRLAQCLAAAGALVYIARLPSRPDGRHWGPDDYLVARGVDSLARLLEEAKPLAEAYSGLDEEVEKLNRDYAVVALGGSVRILRESFDPELSRPRLDFFTQADFELLHKSCRVREGERETAAGAAWLRHPRRRTYERVVLLPGPVDERTYNLWKGFSVEPKPGDWSLLQNHLRENVCQGNEGHFQYLLDWLADGVQHLTRRPGVGLVLRGGEGTGKSTLARHYGHLFGPHCRVVSQARHLVGHFNGHLADCLLLVAEEAFWAGDKQAGGVLKDLLTGDTLNLERKGKDAILIPNRLRALFLSNEAWVIPAGLDARRFFVLDVGEAHKQDRAYFAAIEAQMKAGGYEAMLHDLLTRDLTQADLGAIPQTPALLEQKILSFGPIERFWYGCLQRGEVVAGRRWEELTPTEEVHDAYLLEATKLGDRRRSSETELGMLLTRLCPTLSKLRRTVAVRKPDPDLKGRYLTETRRTNCYQFPALEESRKSFEQVVRAPLDWGTTPTPEPSSF